MPELSLLTPRPKTPMPMLEALALAPGSIKDELRALVLRLKTPMPMPMPMPKSLVPEHGSIKLEVCDSNTRALVH